MTSLLRWVVVWWCCDVTVEMDGGMVALWVSGGW